VSQIAPLPPFRWLQSDTERLSEPLPDFDLLPGEPPSHTVKRVVGRPVYSAEQRCEAIRRAHVMAKHHGWPEVPCFPPHDRTMVLACYGPSLKRGVDGIADDVAAGGDLFTVSGAHDFLIDQGIVPRAHIECDPRPHKAKMIRHHRRDVSYMMASACNVETLARAVGFDANLFHVGSTDDEDALISKLWPGSWTTVGGTTVGSSALSIGSALGYASFSVHAMDASFDAPPEMLWASPDTTFSPEDLAKVGFHAGPHPNEDQVPYRVWVGERPFFVSAQMMQLAQDFVYLRKSRPGFRFILHGDGFLRALVEAIDAGLPLVTPGRTSNAKLTIAV
jgi:hypothetical protein